MHPVLFEIGSYDVAGYGLALALSFALGTWLTAARIAIDSVRHHDAPTVLFRMLGGSPFTMTTLICVCMIAVGIAGLLWLRRGASSPS